MLYWKANFQIPNSGVQAAEVFAVAEQENDKVIVNFYSDELNSNLLFQNEFEVDEKIDNLDDYLLELKEFSNYTKV